MSFSVLERVVSAAKILQGGVIDSDGSAQWYESVRAFEFALPYTKIWMDSDGLRANPAGDLATAQANVAGPLAGIVEDLSGAASAVRLSPLPGLNNTFISYTTYNDFSSPHLDNWLKPSFIPQSSGAPSNGYASRLYDGDPSGAGSEVLTTDGTTGTGINKSVGWVWNYDNGILLLAGDFVVADPWIIGFRYIGAVAGSGGSSNIDGGRPAEIYGGISGSPIDGGDPTSF